MVSGMFSGRSKTFSGLVFLVENHLTNKTLKLVVATKPLKNTKFSGLVVYNLDN